jgi:hypothetical protein
MRTTRRHFLEIAAAGATAAAFGLPSLPSIAHAATESPAEFFLFIIALGGWDVTLWADPRNELKGIVHPASTSNTDTSQLKLWADAPLGDGDKSDKTFQLVRPARSNLVFGPGIGDLAEMPDRITVINGLAMNTVAHPDGQTFSATGRHPQGGRVAAASIDTVLSNELGKDQLLPTVSIRFPSSFVGDNLDRRVVPLAVDDVGSLARTVTRSALYDSSAERDRVTALLSEEATELAKRSTYPDVLDGMSLQYKGLSKMLGSNLQEVFSKDGLKKVHPELDYKSRFAGGSAINAAFAIESFKRNLVRCVSFAIGGFDTHANNYRTHAQLQQETFGLVASIVRSLDATPHPTKAGAKLSEHTHILVVSDFCRTPQINLALGRDHYPNNSALVVSPRFKTNFAFGKTDEDQLLPAPVRKFTDGERAIAPPDLLATFVSAFGVEPRKYMRDGEVVKELLAT